MSDYCATEAKLEAAVVAFLDELHQMVNCGEHRQANEAVAMLETLFAIEKALIS